MQVQSSELSGFQLAEVAWSLAGTPFAFHPTALTPRLQHPQGCRSGRP